MKTHQLLLVVITLVVITVLGTAPVAMAQCPVAGNGDPTITAALQRLDGEVVAINGRVARIEARLDRLERITVATAEAGAFGRRQEEPYRLVSLRDESPQAASQASQGGLPETGRFSFTVSSFGAASLRFPVAGGMLAVGNELPSAGGHSGVAMDDNSNPFDTPSPSHYRPRAPRVPVRAASYAYGN